MSGYAARGYWARGYAPSSEDGPSVQESAATAEISGVVLGLQEDQMETATASDAASVGQLGMSVLEDQDAVESSTRALGAAQAQAEAAAALDEVTGTSVFDPIFVSGAEVTAAAELLSRVAAQAADRVEATTTSEAAQAIKSAAPGVTESGASADASTASSQALAVSAEAATAGDASNGTSELIRGTLEQGAALEVAARSASLAVSMDELAAALDAVGIGTAFAMTVSEQTTALESISQAVEASRSVTEASPALDVLLKGLAVPVDQVEVAMANDLADRMAGMRASGVESMVLFEEQAGFVEVIAGIIETSGALQEHAFGIIGENIVMSAILEGVSAEDRVHVIQYMLEGGARYVIYHGRGQRFSIFRPGGPFQK